MESGNQQLTADGPHLTAGGHHFAQEGTRLAADDPGTAAAGPSYPVLKLRWWLACARLEARVAVKAVRPQDTDDDRRLAAFAVAGAMAVLLLMGAWSPTSRRPRPWPSSRWGSSAPCSPASPC